MWVKICGTTNLEDALLAAEAGADAVGFVFAPSARRVATEQVAEIVGRLPEGLEKVGVFPAADAEKIGDAVAGAGLTAVQLHGRYDEELARGLSGRFGSGLKILQTVNYASRPDDQELEDKRFVEEIRAVTANPAVWAVLLDTAVRGSSGGTGVAFNWEAAAGLLRQAWPEGAGCRLIVAGGLRPENVRAAIETLRPWGVDVVSGVEQVKGRKDAERVKIFVECAKQ